MGGFVGGAWGGDVNAAEAKAVDGTFYNDPGASYGYGLDNAVTFGATLGCNYHLPGSALVLGVEGELGSLRLRGSAVDPNSADTASDTRDNTKLGNWYGVLAGRLGVTVDRSLLYVKAGVARLNVDSRIADTCSVGPCGPALLTATGSQRDDVWVIGGGLEYALNNKWTIRGEYLRFGQIDGYELCGPVTVGGATVAQVCSRHNVDAVHVLKIGVSYKFEH